MPAEAEPVVDRSAGPLLTFGAFAFDPRNGILSRGGTEIALPPRVIGVLALLVSRRGEVVSRQELLDQVWKDAFVTDTSLAEAVSFLRQALGDDPQAPRYIQTVHRRGYRFVAPVGGVRAGGTEISPPAGVTVRPSIARELAPWSVAIIFAALAVAAGWRLARQPAAEAPPTVRFEIRPVAGTWLDRRAPALAVSADGRAIAWSACDGSTAVCGLYVRHLDRIEAVRLAGTDGAESPFFSPDGRWLGFFADGKLKKVAISGGAPVTLADAPVPAGGAWNRDGRIVFAGLPAGGLSVASDQGGEVTVLTTPRPQRGEIRHAWPSWLGDGTTILFSIVTSPLAGSPGEVAILPQGSKSWRVIRSGVARALPAGGGHLLLSTGGDLQAATFDPLTLSLTGGTDSAFNGLATVNGLAQFDLAPAGTLVAARSASGQRRVTWGDDTEHPLNDLLRLQSIVIAPDGRHAAGVIPEGSGSDVWSVDLTRNGLTRITYGGVNGSPVWCGDRLVFASRGDTAFAPGRPYAAIKWPAGRASSSHVFPTSCTSDGRLAATITQPSAHTAVGIVLVDGTIRLFDEGPFDDGNAVFSPDGEWLAFDSDESGRREIYLRHLPGGNRVALSTDGGEHPRWSSDGRWIYYVVGNRFVRVRLGRAAGSGDAEPPRSAEPVFDRPGAQVLAVAPGGRLLIEQRPLALDSVVVAVQWLRELRQRLPVPVSAPR